MRDERQTMSRRLNLRFRFIPHPSSLILLLALCASGCGRSSSTESLAHNEPAPQPPPAASLPSDAEATEGSIRFLEARVKNDPDDFIAYNKLAGYYLQRQREVGDVKYLELASRAARASLNAMPADQNLGGLTALAQTEYAAHDFTSARDHALELIEY